MSSFTVTDKSSVTNTASMAATIAALHGTTVSKNSEGSLISASTAVSPDSITAATLLAAAAAHAAATAISARRSEDTDSNKGDDEDHSPNPRDIDKNLEVNVDDDDSDSLSTEQRNKIEDTNTSRGVISPHSIIETDNYEGAGEDIVNNSTKSRSSSNAPGTEIVTNTLSNCADKQRRKAGKDITREKCQ